MGHSSPKVVIVSKQKQRSRKHDRGSALLSLKLIPELSAAALKAKLDKEMALWYCLRSLNVTGSGRLPYNDAVAALVSFFGYSERTAYRLLKAGNGKLWDITTPPGVGLTTIKIWGLCRVCECLCSIFHLSRPVEIKARDFRGLQARRAQLYATFFKPDGARAKPISRDSIEIATGVSRRQQRRYDKMAGINRVANFAFQQDGKSLVAMFDVVSGKARQWRVVRRLGRLGEWLGKSTLD